MSEPAREVLIRKLKRCDGAASERDLWGDLRRNPHFRSGGPEGVRRHIDAMEAEGIVRRVWPEQVNRGPGRPPSPLVVLRDRHVPGTPRFSRKQHRAPRTPEEG